MGIVFGRLMDAKTVQGFRLVDINDLQLTRIASKRVGYKNGIWNSNSKIYNEPKNEPGFECASTGTESYTKNLTALSKKINQPSTQESKLATNNGNLNERDAPPIMKLVIHQSSSAKAQEKELELQSESTLEMPKLSGKVLESPTPALRHRKLTKKDLDNCKLCSRSKSKRRSFRTTSKPMVTQVMGKSDGSNFETQLSTKTVPSSKTVMPTTMMIGRLSPQPRVEPDVPPFLSFEYQYNSETNKEYMDFSAPISSLIEELDPDFEYYGCDDKNTELSQKTLFFKHFNTIVNNSYGEIEWNGITIVLTDGINSRLKLWNFETEPSKLDLDLAGCTEMHVFKAKSKMEVRGQEVDRTKKWFRMTGEDVALIKISDVQNGKFSLTLPGL